MGFIVLWNIDHKEELCLRGLGMCNIIDYVKNNCTHSFDECPFTEVDSLVFSQLSYILFDGFVNKIPEFKTTLMDIMNSYNYPNLYNKVRVPEQNKQLLEAAAGCKRFSQVKLGYYINEIDTVSEKQFSAISFKLVNDLYYISYRGTDDSIVGWKEDFNMAFMSSIPAQKDAVSYFKCLVSNYPNSSFILGGHSKGGNIAVYAAVFSTQEIQQKIINVYNHDGPGFKEDVLDLVSFDRIKNCIRKTIPQSSLIGMLLQQHEPYSVVVSSGFTIMQHDPFTWEIDGADYIYAEDLTDLSKGSGKIIQDWLSQIDDETRKVFVDALFNLLINVKATTFSELRTNLRENAPIILSSIKTTDPDIRKTVSKILYKLISVIAVELRQSAAGKLANIRKPEQLINKLK